MATTTLSPPIKKPLTPTLNSGAGIASSLTGAFLFTEGLGTTVADTSPSPEDADLTGFAAPDSSWSTERYGYALDFDEANNSVATSGSKFNLSGDVTLSVRFKGAARSGDSIGWVASKDTGGTGFPFRVGIRSDGKIEGRAYINGSERVLTSDLVTDSSTWYQAAIRWHASNDELSLWVNGTKEKTTAPGGALLQDGDLFFRMGQASSSTERLDGMLDHVLLWNRALSDDEMREAHFNPYAMFRNIPIPEFEFVTRRDYALVANDPKMGPVLRGERTEDTTRRFGLEWRSLTLTEKNNLEHEFDALLGEVGWFYFTPAAIGESTAVRVRFMESSLSISWTQGNARGAEVTLEEL